MLVVIEASPGIRPIEEGYPHRCFLRENPLKNVAART